VRHLGGSSLDTFAATPRTQDCSGTFLRPSLSYRSTQSPKFAASRKYTLFHATQTINFNFWQPTTYIERAPRKTGLLRFDTPRPPIIQNIRGMTRPLDRSKVRLNHWLTTPRSLHSL